MHAGELRHQCVLQTKSSQTNTGGEDVVTWGTETSFWASISPLRGERYFSAKQLNSAVSHIIRTRSIVGVNFTTAKRITFDSRNFLIDAVINVDERDRQLEIYCVEDTD